MSALLDTGFILALLSTNEVAHKRCLQVMENEQEPLIPTPVLPELAYMAIRNVGYEKFITFVRFALLGRPKLIYPVEADFSRIADLMEKYADSRLDFVDCAITAMAERLNISRILTVDQRDFRMIRPSHIPAFEILP
ncbi:type II toxin-antitoxin system VapC family toxin [Candidatus Leptofilum sp.]|uniref:type II toxin-antitoxin system VapC family toxin n=1 Tax=Candidatus Leptofilum sp. TaxID=3241576 RepID=UPI003B5A538D